MLFLNKTEQFEKDTCFMDRQTGEIMNLNDAIVSFFNNYALSDENFTDFFCWTEDGIGDSTFYIP